MHELKITMDDATFAAYKLRAERAGYTNPAEYIGIYLAEELPTAGNIDHLFTKERLEIIDRAVEQADSGEVFTREEVEADFAIRKAEWLKKRNG